MNTIDWSDNEFASWEDNKVNTKILVHGACESSARYNAMTYMVNTIGIRNLSMVNLTQWGSQYTLAIRRCLRRFKIFDEFVPHLLIMLDRMDFSKVITEIVEARSPGNEKLTIANTILYPIPSHVNGLRSF